MKSSKYVFSGRGEFIFSGVRGGWGVGVSVVGGGGGNKRRETMVIYIQLPREEYGMMERWGWDGGWGCGGS